VSDAGRKTAQLVAEIAELRDQLGSVAAENEALRRREARYRALAEHASDLIAEVDATGRFVFVSDSCRELVGYRAEEIVGRSLTEDLALQVHADDRATLLEAFREVTAAGGSGRIEYRFRHADGTWRWFESRAKARRTAEGELCFVVDSRDVTHRVLAEQALRESEARYRALFSSTHDFVAELDAEGRVLFMSPSCETILGFEPEAMIGTTPFSLLHTDDVERLADSFLQRVEARRPAGEGSVFRVRHRDGSWRWLQGGGVSYATADGRSRVVCVCRDVTREVLAEAERRRMDEWMQQARSFESLGVLAGGIAHDFNNLLTPILGEAGLALLELPERSPLRARLERIRSAAQRAGSLTAEMLHYAGLGSIERGFVDVSDLADGMRELLESGACGRARLELDLAAGLPPVEGDRRRLAQALRNLVANAAEASPEGGRVVVRTGAVDLDRAALSRCFLGQTLPEGRYVRVEVEDTGTGMDAETRERLFDPFFSTRSTGRGLGLAAVLGIVRSHAGAIDVQSDAGRGTRVALLLPCRADAAGRRPRRTAPSVGEGGAKVLVVEDDEAVRELAGETLRRAGFVPVCVAEGADALAWLGEAEAGIRAVVLDWPGAGCGEVLDALRGLRPDVRLVLLCGHPPEAVAAALGPLRPDGLVQKPFLPADLVLRVREALGNPLS
jgi:PAS domain S-box-containing protein